MRSRHWTLLAMLAMLPLAMLCSLAVGVYPVSPAALVHTFMRLPGVPPTERVVIEVIRAPRVALATLVGIGLGLSGASLQGLFRNPLVGPDIVGVSSGAACGGVIALALGGSSGYVIASAFLGGLSSLGLVAGIARSSRSTGVLGIVLAGVLVSAFGSAIVGVVEFFSDPNSTLANIVYWLMGSFVGADPTKVAIVGGATVIGGGGVLLLRWRLNLLSLGDQDAAALGVSLDRLRWAIIALVTLIVAAQVAICGIVGWAGLIVPHVARALVGPDHRRLLPASGLLGGILLLLTDDLARTIAGQEIPIGLLTALIGTPVFAVMLRRAQKRIT